MALVKCPECNKEISDKSTTCIHCGFPLDSIKTVHNDERKSILPTNDILKTIKDLKNNKKVVIIATLTIIALSICIIATNSFSSKDKYGLQMVEKYQNILKNPDSLVLRSDVAVISYSRDGKTYKYVFFDASGENSYGATVSSTPCFVNGQYLCDSDEIPSASEYMSMSDSEAREYLGLQLALATWQVYGEDSASEKEDVIESYSISASKIAKKLHIEYK